jgi:hypothetical protein
MKRQNIEPAFIDRVRNAPQVRRCALAGKQVTKRVNHIECSVYFAWKAKSGHIANEYGGRISVADKASIAKVDRA